MVRKLQFVENRSPFEPAFCLLGNQMVIDPPAEVFCPCSSPVAPPAVFLGTLVILAEGIYKTRSHKLVEPLAFFGQKAGHFGMAPRVVDVDGLVADVVISANQQMGSLLPQFVYVLAEIGQKFHLEILPQVARGAGRNINAKNGKIAVVGSDDTPFGIVGWIAHADDHLVGLATRKNAHTAVSFFFGRVEIVVVASDWIVSKSIWSSIALSS